MKKYNITEMHPEKEFERHVFHRERFSHYLRWTHILKIAKIGQNVLDVGCGSGNLYEVFYRNRYSPNNFTGVDIRKQIIEKNRIKFPKANWHNLDIVNDELPISNWDIIVLLETMEHIGKSNGQKLLDNIKQVMNKNTELLISTPCYDEKVGAADNHTYDCGDGKGIISQEYYFNELKELLENNFEIIDVFGTFASQKDYKPLMSEWQIKTFDHLIKYYDSNLISNIMAPFFPEHSRNCLWKLKLK